MSTLADVVNNERARPVYEIRVNGVLLKPSNPNDAQGVPGVKSFQYDDTVAQIDLTNCPIWMKAGQVVTIDAGLVVNNITYMERQWTGFLLALPGEDPEYLRDKVIVTGATITIGTPPDTAQEQITAAATLVGADIQPPLPAGVHIEHEIPNNLVHDSTRASWLATQYIARFGQVPLYPDGTPGSQTIICTGEIYKANRAYQLAAIDIGGLTDEQAIQAILALSGITAYSLIAPDVGWYTLAADAIVSRGRPIDMLQTLLELGQLQPVHTKAGVLAMRQVKWGPAPTAAWTYDTTEQTKARILSATRELEVIWNPFIEKFSTGQVKIPFLNVNGRHFVESVRHVWPEKGMPVTRFRGMGGSRLGGTVKINPVASFLFHSVRQAAAGGELLIVQFDASSSFDPDGSIDSYAWSGTFTGSGKFFTATVDPTLYPSGFPETLTVTDLDGLTHAVTLTIPVVADGTKNAPVQPALYAALEKFASASPGAGTGWNDSALTKARAVGAKIANGTDTGHVVTSDDDRLVLSTDGDASVTQVLAPTGVEFAYVVWDWRNSLLVWACDIHGNIYRSGDSGASFTLYVALRTKLSKPNLIAGRRCIGLPAAGGIYFFGGDGAGSPVIAFDPVAAVTSGAWYTVAFTGDLAADLPMANANCRIIDYVAPGNGTEVMALEGADSVGLYATTSPPGTSRAFTRATGGVPASMVYVLGDYPPNPMSFYAAAGDRDVWQSSDGIAWINDTNKMPVGVTPHDAISISDPLTGIPGMAGVWDVAARNAGKTAGIYKVVYLRGAANVYAVRPGADTWPTNGEGMAIAIGAAGATVANFGQLLRMSDVMQSFDGSSHWATLGTPPGGLNKLINLGGGHLLAQDSGTSDVYHSADGGATWAATYSATADRTASPPVVGADGSVWLVESGSGTTNNTNSTKGLRVRKSTDHGATFPIVYTDAGYGTAQPTRAMNTQHSIAADKWNANNVFILCEGGGTGEPKCIFSVNGGASFTRRTSVSVAVPHHQTADDMQFINSGRVLFLNARDGEPWYSDDYGDNWTNAGSLGDVGECLGSYKSNWFNVMLVAVDDVSGFTHVFASQDNGATWTDIYTAASFYDALEYAPTIDTAYIGRVDSTIAISGAVHGTPTASDISFDETATGAGFGCLALP